jgi:ABC-type phosphate/phosphonate transport system permease subunit
MNWISKTHHSTLLLAAEKKKQKQFLWMISLISFAVLGYQYYLVHTLNYSPAFIGGLTLLISLVSPLIALPFLYIWMFIGNILSEITSTIILGFIYFLILTPIGLIKKNEENTGWLQPKNDNNFNEQF